jgi:DNA repair protein RadD
MSTEWDEAPTEDSRRRWVRDRAIQRVGQLLGDDPGARKARELLGLLDGATTRGMSTEMLLAGMLADGDETETFTLPDDALVPLIIDTYGDEILSNSTARRNLLEGIEHGSLAPLMSHPGVRAPQSSQARVIEYLAGKSWRPGGSWARRFAETLGLPIEMAGSRGAERPTSLVEVSPFRRLPPLEDFQHDVAEQLLGVLSALSTRRRAIVTLPTGAGKTRVAVEVICAEIMAGRAGTVLWIAQSEELCEQAVTAFEAVWTDLGARPRGPEQPLIVARHWADHHQDDNELDECDVVVATIQKLDQANPDDELDTGALFANVGIIIVDEAHRANSPSYRRLFERFGLLPKQSAPPWQLALDPGSEPTERQIPAIVGLTATPRRSGVGETEALHRLFGGTILRPRNLGADHLTALRSVGVLAQVDNKVLRYRHQAAHIRDEQRYIDHYSQWGDLHPGLLAELGEERYRNRVLVDCLLELDPSWPVLLFACSIQHARALTAVLNRSGRNSACVTGNTRSSTRRRIISEFREGQISVLSNYGVLTTGFDAPQVRAVVVARPTASHLLYEQMVGRGLRGPRFGGTDRCLVIDVEDNLHFSTESGLKPVGLTYQTIHRDWSTT